jgi:hypothetical protein
MNSVILGMYSITLTLTITHVFFIVIFAYLAISFFRASGRAFEIKDAPRWVSHVYFGLGLSIYALIGVSLVVAYMWS